MRNIWFTSYFLIFIFLSLVGFSTVPKIVYRSDLFRFSPCISSLFIAASKEHNCRSWNPNVISEPSFDTSRLLVFVGNGQNSISVVDHLNGKVIKNIASKGKVITKVLFSNDGTRFFIGTDQGYLMAFDSYSFDNVFNLYLDSSLNNDFLIDNNLLFLSTVKNTVYSIDISLGVIKWSLERPLKKDRLKLASFSKLYLINSVYEKDKTYLVSAHSDGFLSYIDISSGELKKNVNIIDTNKNLMFPDIVFSELVNQKFAWFSSYDGGVYFIDLHEGRKIRHFDIKGVVSISHFNQKLFLLTLDKLYCTNEEGRILWHTDISSYYSKKKNNFYPFLKPVKMSHSFFNSSQSNAIFFGSKIVFSFDGGIGVFCLNTGRLLGVLGNGVSFGPYLKKIDEQSFLALSTSGLLYYFTL